MTKEERLKDAEAVTLKVEWKDHDKIVLTNKNGDTYTSKSEDLMDFLHSAGAEAEAERNKSVSIQDAKQFMWEWLNRADMLDVSLDNDDIQLLMADFANHLNTTTA